MNAVLYTQDFEPITVVDIPMGLWNRLKKGYEIRLLVERDFRHRHKKFEGMEMEYIPLETVQIYGEVFRKRDKEALMLFTRDEEHALALKAAFLPGQVSEVQKREGYAFENGFGEGTIAAIGFLDALRKLRGDVE